MAGLFELIKPKDDCFWLSYRIERQSDDFSLFKIDTNIRWADFEEPPCIPLYFRPEDFRLLVSPHSIWITKGKGSWYTNRVKLFKDTIKIYFTKKKDKWILKDKYIPMVEREY